jgi:hypothetical protein
LRIKSSLIALVAVAAWAAFAPSAMAETPGTDVAACTFAGTASTTPGVGWGPNSGTYAFQTVKGACVAEDTTNLTEVEVVLVDIASNGNYTNTMCGTGGAGGSATISANPAALDLNHEFPANIDYTIAFTAGQGILTVTGGSHADGTGASGIGVVSIQPDPTQGLPDLPPPPIGPADGKCTHGFVVEGAAVVTLTDTVA